MPLLVSREGECVDLAQLTEASVPEAQAAVELWGSNLGQSGKDQQEQMMSPAVPTPQNRCQARKVLLAAETGHPETSKEFAVRMSRSFVLKGPQQRKEGKDTGRKLM
ncbi:hypothetical protein C0992_007531 [Termitomyces sp. T32_za158]|nr:hypothetical protein C0992_007531 [Termitomyces sp. T32_za158]